MFKKLLLMLLASLIVLSFSAASCTTTPNTHETTPPALSWDVLNVATNVDTSFNNTNAGTVSFTTSESYQSYNIVAHANDAGGIKSMTFDGSGTFECIYVYPNADHAAVNTLGNLPVTLPHQADNPTPDAQGNVRTYSNPGLFGFMYHSLSCGQHYAGNSGDQSPGYHEFTALCGVLTLTVTATNFSGLSASGQLQLSPGC